jgi:hypothetical protein
MEEGTALVWSARKSVRVPVNGILKPQLFMMILDNGRRKGDSLDDNSIVSDLFKLQLLLTLFLSGKMKENEPLREVESSFESQRPFLLFFPFPFHYLILI